MYGRLDLCDLGLVDAHVVALAKAQKVCPTLQSLQLSRNFISHIGIEALAEAGEWHASNDGESKMQVMCTKCSTAVVYRKRSVRKLACLKCGEITYRPIHYLHEIEAKVRFLLCSGSPLRSPSFYKFGS